MISKTLSYFYEYYIDPRFSSKNYKYPTHINFPITDNCNSKCRMCNVWKDKSENELSVEEIKSIFSDKLFIKAKHIGISGGEPTLRTDLASCVEVILNSLKTLETLTITSHGFHPTKWERMLPQIQKLCNSKKVSFKLNISVDGIGDLHEEVRRIEGGWDKVLKTISVTKKYKCPLQIQCTVSKHNIYGVNEVLHFAEKNDIEFIFRKATSINRLYNKKITDEFFTNNPEDSFFADFLNSNALLGATENPARRLFYKDLRKMLLKGKKRTAPCHFQNNGVLISAHGEMFHCSIDEKPLGDCRKLSAHEIYFSEKSRSLLDELMTDVCPKCEHDQSGSWNPFKLMAEVIGSKFDIISNSFQYLKFSFRNVGMILGFNPRNVDINTGNKRKTVHVIGAYGGEHVGDSAILGGVIIRILDRDSEVSEIVVYSKRADRTQFWVNGLDFNSDVSLIVKDYEELNKVKNISKEDELVWAGGPIMEMPVDLFEHYCTIKAFTAKKLKFIIEGCGWGPFKTKYSKYVANRILQKASLVQMRDEYDLSVSHTVRRDPAFDYLAGSSNSNIENWTWQKHKIDAFIQKTKIKGSNNKLVLLNLRPIWSKYNKSNTSSDFLDELMVKKAYETIKYSTDKNLTFISVPFNTDHYGFSDMIPALRLKDLCDEHGVDNYHVFDRELNAREMIYFLKNFDSGVCMRFHACIFMMSMKIPVYGIDYTAGEIGKVGGLFKSFNNDNYANIMHLDSKHIVTFLESHS